MKIIKGTFGNTGKISIDGDRLAINAARKSSVTGEQIVSVVASTNKEQKFGLVGCVVGIAILSTVLFMLLGPVGAVIGIVISVAGSFYTQKSNQVEIKLNDGGWLTAECSRHDMERLVNFGHRNKGQSHQVTCPDFSAQ